MTRDEIKNIPEIVDFMLDKCILADSRTKVFKRLKEVCDLAIKSLEQQTCEDAVSRETAIEAVKQAIYNHDSAIMRLAELPPVNPQPKMGQFAKWVATEIFDDMWEYNKDAFAEIACRKLAKIGIVRAKGDKWELVEPQESEVEE